MKQFIHEKFIAENADDIKKLPDGKLPESLQAKITSFDQAKAKVYAMHDKIKKNDKIRELDLLSNDIMQQVEAELEELETPATVNTDIAPRKEPVIPPAAVVEPPIKKPDTEKKKKKGGIWGWIITGALAVGVGAIAVDYVKNKNGAK